MGRKCAYSVNTLCFFNQHSPLRIFTAKCVCVVPCVFAWTEGVFHFYSVIRLELMQKKDVSFYNFILQEELKNNKNKFKYSLFCSIMVFRRTVMFPTEKTQSILCKYDPVYIHLI